MKKFSGKLFGISITVFILMLLKVLPANASLIDISPTQIYLSANSPIEILKITNADDKPTIMQVQLVRWSQHAGEDNYTPTEDILATPPLFRLPPHETQIIRFAKLHLSPPAQQQTYRIFLKEISLHPQKKSLSGAVNQLRILLNFSLPLFIQPQEITQKFSWSAHALSGENIDLQFMNTGNVTVLLSQLQKKNIFVYVLPQQKYNWVIHMPVKTHTLMISADINGQIFHARVQVA